MIPDQDDARAVLAIAAAVLRGHSDELVQAIGDWLGDGAAGDVLEILDPEALRRRWLAQAVERPRPALARGRGCALVRAERVGAR